MIKSLHNIDNMCILHHFKTELYVLCNGFLAQLVRAMDWKSMCPSSDSWETTEVK